MAVTDEKKYHVGLAKGEVGEYVLVPGDPGRTPMIAKYLDGAREVAFNREYRTFTGSLLGVPVSAISSGMGGPSVAIAVEELNELGVHTFLRVGTINLCVDELGAGEIHHLDPSYMDRMLRVAVDALKLLIEHDRAAARK